MRLEPARTIIEFLGGAQVVAAIVGKHISGVYRWTYPLDGREGTGGLVPSRDQVALLEHARANAIDLRPDDFFSADRLQALLKEQKVAEAAAE